MESPRDDIQSPDCCMESPIDNIQSPDYCMGSPIDDIQSPDYCMESPRDNIQSPEWWTLHIPNPAFTNIRSRRSRKIVAYTKSHPFLVDFPKTVSLYQVAFGLKAC